MTRFAALIDAAPAVAGDAPRPAVPVPLGGGRTGGETRVAYEACAAADDTDWSNLDVARLRAARRALAWALHPDRGGGPAAAERLARVNAAIDAELKRLADG